MYIPLLGRLEVWEWPLIFLSFILAWIETIVSTITNVLPVSVLKFFGTTTRIIFNWVSDPVQLIYQYSDTEKANNYLKYNVGSELDQDKYNLMVDLLNSKNIQEMCQLFGYDVENRIVKTKDDYLLTVQRIIRPGVHVEKNGKVVYLHHGLLMNSEIWVTMLDKNLNLPFILYDLGYDVWLGNNRGNKYSQKHLYYKVNSEQFWNFSIDEFAMFDIPDTIDYILNHTEKKQLTYIGFSQGTAQAFASVAINADLNKKLEKVIAISPATTPHGLYSGFLDILLKSSPSFVFLLFSRRVLMPSVVFWQNIMYPPLFNSLIDISNYCLFNWRSKNITREQKISSFAHLYSTTSVKTVVHWFQIISSKNFQMYHDSYSTLSGYTPISYPLKSISVPIYLIYGTSDSLVDINIMKNQLPTGVIAHPVEGHEHLDNLWGEDVDQKVFSHVLKALQSSDNTPDPEPLRPTALATGSHTAHTENLISETLDTREKPQEQIADVQDTSSLKVPSSNGSVFI